MILRQSVVFGRAAYGGSALVRGLAVLSWLPVMPASGALQVVQLDEALSEEWIVLSLILYVITGVFWLPVVWMQMRLRDLALEAVASGAPLPPAYHRLFWTRFAFGFPAFAAVLGILWLMITRPQLGLL